MKVVVRVAPLAVVVAALQMASPALAAFPGSNGLLAVQPRSGGGIVLVGADGTGARRICATRCGAPRRPRWSPDGRALVFAGPGIKIVYPDGSCMDCEFGAAPNPAFGPGGAVISFIQHGQVTLDGIDGIRQKPPSAGAASDAVWSTGGLLAIVRDGGVWAGPPGALRLIGLGTQPSWSPDGTEVAVSHGGWVWVVGVRSRRARPLVRGTAPAFSPDGRRIAFIAPNHRLMVVTSRGRHPVAKAVGVIQAVSVDWQPQPTGSNPGCPVPPGATALASSSAALVIGDGAQPPADPSSGQPLAYMGCLRADGRQRLLERIVGNNFDSADVIDSAVLAAPYAALIDDWHDSHYGGRSTTVQVFDLRTGSRQSKLGGETFTECDD